MERNTSRRIGLEFLVSFSCLFAGMATGLSDSGKRISQTLRHRNRFRAMLVKG
jgi:hypothetical protein